MGAPRARRVVARDDASRGCAGGPEVVGRPAPGRRGSADGVLDEVEDAVEVLGGHARGEAADEPVEHQPEEVDEQRDRDVGAHDARRPLALQPLGRRAGDGVLALRPQLGEGGVGAQAAAHLELDAEPAGVLVAQVAHDLHEAGALDDLGGAGGVVLRQRQEQRLLVAEVVEDRAPRQPGLGLEDADGGALVAVPRERPARGAPGSRRVGRRAGRRSPWARTDRITNRTSVSVHLGRVGARQNADGRTPGRVRLRA